MIRRKVDRTRLAGLSLALALTLLAGCGGNDTVNTVLPPAPAPVYNPNPNDPLKDVTTDNESANMDKLRKAGAR